MEINISLNETTIKAINFKEESTNKRPIKIGFDFYVTSEEYHDVTGLLYENDFKVKVPKKNLNFRATITNYSTSITDLNKAGEVGLFHLELTEKLES